MYKNPWLYHDQIWEPTEEELKDLFGFVYCITDPNGMKYIGKKQLWSKRTLKPLKGKKRKRRKIVESDWKEYYGSSETVKSLVEETNADGFKREILHFCKSKGELSYKELQEQMDRRVLFKPDKYHNGIIQVRINRIHVLDKM